MIYISRIYGAIGGLFALKVILKLGHQTSWISGAWKLHAALSTNCELIAIGSARGRKKEWSQLCLSLLSLFLQLACYARGKTKNTPQRWFPMIRRFSIVNTVPGSAPLKLERLLSCDQDEKAGARRMLHFCLRLRGLLSSWHRCENLHIFTVLRLQMQALEFQSPPPWGTPRHARGRDLPTADLATAAPCWPAVQVNLRHVSAHVLLTLSKYLCHAALDPSWFKIAMLARSQLEDILWRDLPVQAATCLPRGGALVRSLGLLACSQLLTKVLRNMCQAALHSLRPHGGTSSRQRSEPQNPSWF